MSQKGLIKSNSFVVSDKRARGVAELYLDISFIEPHLEKDSGRSLFTIITGSAILFVDGEGQIARLANAIGRTLGLKIAGGSGAGE